MTESKDDELVNAEFAFVPLGLHLHDGVTYAAPIEAVVGQKGLEIRECQHGTTILTGESLT